MNPVVHLSSEIAHENHWFCWIYPTLPTVSDTIGDHWFCLIFFRKFHLPVVSRVVEQPVRKSDRFCQNSGISGFMGGIYGFYQPGALVRTTWGFVITFQVFPESLPPRDDFRSSEPAGIPRFPQWELYSDSIRTIPSTPDSIGEIWKCY